MTQLRVRQPGLELWGGAECTVNRVGDVWFEQLHRSGHHGRIGDLDLFASLGLTALRFPVLWERTAPQGLEDADWEWPGTRLRRLQELHIRPIVGLLHHGHGPEYTNLMDAQFPEKFAEYASAVAQRYPWVDAYTPINEPLTTARFCGLYGFWYPHARDAVTFTRLLLAQCKATALSMQAIRRVNPAAKLIQNEDVGKAHGTPTLAYETEYQNERRWLTFDILCGRVDRSHLFWPYFRNNGASEAELLWFLENPCPPDILGFDYYISSERFLDDGLDRYPAHTWSDNDRHRYADVAAAQVKVEGIDGPRALLRETWERYSIPIAVTEAHLGCTREEQIRWVVEVWRSAEGARRDGVDVRAVTAWALLGLYDWNSLVTCENGQYEAGVFDVRGPTPRPTAIADTWRTLAQGRDPSHVLLAVPGWWRRPERFIFGFAVDAAGRASGVLKDDEAANRQEVATTPPLMLVGNGTLGKAFARLCSLRGIPYQLLSASDIHSGGQESLRCALDRYKPWALVNTAGYGCIDGAEHDVDRWSWENASGAGMLAAACSLAEVPLVTFSCDGVFGDDRAVERVESIPTFPHTVYAGSLSRAERIVLQAFPKALIIRSGPTFGPWDADNELTCALQKLSRGESVALPVDETVSLSYIPDLVNESLDLLIDNEHGVWNVVNPGEASWFQIVERVATLMGINAERLRGVPAVSLGRPAPRSSGKVLTSTHVSRLPTMEDALVRYARDGCHLFTGIESPTSRRLETPVG